MKQIVPFEMASGAVVYIEAEAPEEMTRSLPASRGGRVATVWENEQLATK